MVNDDLHLIHVTVELYGWSHFSDNIEASFLKKTLVALLEPPVRDMMTGVKDPHSILRTRCSYALILILSCFLYVDDKLCCLWGHGG